MCRYHITGLSHAFALFLKLDRADIKAMRHVHFIHSNTSLCTGLLPDFKANKWLESNKMSCKSCATTPIIIMVLTVVLLAVSIPIINIKYPSSREMDRFRCTNKWIAVKSSFLWREDYATNSLVITHYYRKNSNYMCWCWCVCMDLNCVNLPL